LVPPPLIFVAAFGLAWWLDGRMTFEIDGAGAGLFQTALGVAAIAGGLGLAYWGIVTFARAHTPILPVRPARLLVLTGPYRFTRNPMYLGLTTAYFGVALVLNMAWALVLLPVAMSLLTLLVIEREERHLVSSFGADYERYRQRVRRWI
jgi:protein-S-isoprenylcysteine O-methyltransferase Ste14